MGEFKIDDLIQTMPYTEKEIENFGKLLDFDWKQYDKEEVDFDAKKNIKYIIICAKEEGDLVKKELDKLEKKYQTIKIEQK